MMWYDRTQAIKKVIDILTFVERGDLYYERCVDAVFCGKPIYLEKKHFATIVPTLSSLPYPEFCDVIDEAIYRFMEYNTAYGLALWAKQNKKLRWEFV